MDGRVHCVAVSRQFKVDNLKPNLAKYHSYIHVIFNFFELPTLNCCRTIDLKTWRRFTCQVTSKTLPHSQISFLALSDKSYV